MTAKADFDQGQWQLLVEAPMTAGMIVITAEGGGTFRETFALANAYADARREHGRSELLDAIAGSKPHFDRHRYSTPEELRDTGFEQLDDAVALLREKATADELAEYREFVLSAAAKVAAAHKEHGRQVSPAEQAALDEIRERLERAG
jgi:hypothetical protein